MARKKPTGKTEPQGGGRLSSVATAIRLLKAFSEDEVEIGISALARRLGLAKSTVHRLAVTLVSEGLLEQDRESGKYRLGIALFRLGALVRRRMNVSNEARPYLYELRATINESVHLAILDGTEIMYVYNLEGRTRSARARTSACASRRIAPPRGRRSSRSSRTTWSAASSPPASAAHPEDRHQPGEIRQGARRTRQRGCAIEDEESELGMACIAAPIRDDSGGVVAAVGVAGPVTRLSKKSIAAVIPQVIATAKAVPERLGYRGLRLKSRAAPRASLRCTRRRWR